jgi:hypothetical protein
VRWVIDPRHPGNDNPRPACTHKEVAMTSSNSTVCGPIRGAILTRLVLPLLAGVLLADAARAQSTTWTGTIGNWDTDASWSNGEPTAGVDAIIPLFHTVSINMPGETCRNLLLGDGIGNPTLNVLVGGSLTVAHRIQIPVASAGVLSQEGGTVSADSMVLGAASSIGQYGITGGTLNLDHLVVGPGPMNAQATFTNSFAFTNPTIHVAHSMFVGRGGNVVNGGGALNVGTTSADSVVVVGGWNQTNTPATTVRNFACRPQALVNITIQFNGVSPIVSMGAFIMDGRLSIFDLAAPDGTYELFRGAPLTGAFDDVVLPATGNWSWRIEGNSFLATKGMVPVAPTTWSGVKTQFIDH